MLNVLDFGRIHCFCITKLMPKFPNTHAHLLCHTDTRKHTRAHTRTHIHARTLTRTYTRTPTVPHTSEVL